MHAPRRMRILLTLLAIAVGHNPETNAQAVGGSPMTALACYLQADAEGLESRKAVSLCVGASSVVPALCVEAAEDRLDIDDSLAVDLCRGATSDAPIVCAEQLEDDQPTAELVEYCAALPYPVVPSLEPGNAGCFQRGTDTTLSDEEIMRLCRGAADNSPVACFEAGETETTLADRDLVTLCAAAAVYSPAPVPSGS